MWDKTRKRVLITSPIWIFVSAILIETSENSIVIASSYICGFVWIILLLVVVWDYVEEKI